MSRVEEFKKGMYELNIDGGASKDKWYLFLLADIACSLAVIADKLKAGDPS